VATTTEEMARELGQRVREMREDRGWSRERLGRETGLSSATIIRMERGRKKNGDVTWVMPDMDTLIAVAAGFEVSLPQLLGWSADSDTPGYLNGRRLPDGAVARSAA
jgi:transcriptional regulator with XRE-family HTH domain